MATVTYSKIVEEITELPQRDQSRLLAFLRKRQAEAKVRKFHAEVEKAQRDFRAGKLKSEPVEKLIARLRRDWAEADGK